MPKIRNSRLHAFHLLLAIYRKIRISRSELAMLTGHSTFLVSKLCESLLESRLVTEIGAGDSTGGRRPTLLSVCAGLGRIVGVHLGTVNARIAVTDIAGNLLAFLKAPSRVQAGPAVAIPHLIELIDRALANANSRREELLGVGLGISGVLDRATGTTLFWPKVPQWMSVPVREIVGQGLGILPEVEDTPRTMALAERRLGFAASAQDWIYISLGAGVGAALFLRGELYTGKSGFAGEFGHISVNENGPLCACGNSGCIETMASASALIQAGREAVSKGLSSQLWQLCGGDPNRVSVEVVAEAAAAEDRYSVRLLESIGASLGKGIVSLVQLLDPELIVLGGGVAAALGRHLLPSIQRVVHGQALVRTEHPLRIEVSGLQEVDWAVGASLLVAEKALERVFFGSNEITQKVAASRESRARPHRAEAPLNRPSDLTLDHSIR
jgi:predicted NBD/HSP70 family sugar kinase